ncbi:MAG TPA: MFS transporter [Mycobacteriales bacterium]|nr:MFS transporter [Mycobacteriales bacterium]
MTQTQPVVKANRPYLTLVIVLSATFMQLLDISIVNTGIPSIQESLHTTYANIQLVLAGYQLGFACTLITGARLGDVYGRRKIFMVGMFLFTLTSTLCGAATSAPLLVIGRVLQGISSGLMFPQVLSVIQVTFSPEQRGKALSAFGAAIGLGTIMGPLAGGLLIQAHIFDDAWRAIFYVNVPIGIAALIGAWTNLSESTAPEAPNLDLPGVTLSTIGLGLLVFPLSIGREKSWPWWIIAMLVASIPVLAVFAWYEKKRTADDRSPVLDTRLFDDKAFRIGALLSSVFFAGIPSFFFTFTLYIQVGMGYTALGAGLTTFVFSIGTAIGSARSDPIARRLGPRILQVGTALLVLGMLITILTIHLVGTHPHSYEFIPAFVIAGLGLGFFVAPVTNLILSAIPPQRAGAAAGALSSVQQVGGALGVAVIGVVLFGFLGANAKSSTDAVRPRLEAVAAQNGIPASALETKFADCYSRQAHSPDPRATPSGCERPQGALGTQIGQVGLLATRHNFEKTIQETLVLSALIFFSAFVIVRRLPTPRRPATDGPPEKAVAAH